MRPLREARRPEPTPQDAARAAEAVALLESQEAPARYRCVIEPLLLGRTRVVLASEQLGVLTRYEPNGCFYAAPFGVEGARAMRALLPAGSVTYISDASYAPEVVPGGTPDPYEFWVFSGAEPPRTPETELAIRPLAACDLEVVAAHYALLSRAEMLDHLERGWVLGGFDADGALVGFVGEHDEGSMGMLEVFPTYRRRGYARALEVRQMQRFLAAGRTPYCHVVAENAASKGLQAQLGLVRVGPLQCWVGVPA